MATSSVEQAGAVVDRAGRTWTFDELIAVTSRADSGDHSALRTLETSFDASAWWWSTLGGDIAREAEEGLVVASRKSSSDRLAVRKVLERTRDELAGPSPDTAHQARRAKCGTLQP